MKSRASSHFLILILIVFMTAISHYAVYYGALIRGYETSFTTAGRNIGLLGEQYKPKSVTPATPPKKKKGR